MVGGSADQKSFSAKETHRERYTWSRYCSYKGDIDQVKKKIICHDLLLVYIFTFSFVYDFVSHILQIIVNKQIIIIIYDVN